VVELHRSLTSCPGFFPQDLDGLWARREVLSGRVDRAPGLPDLLVALALHAAFQHGFGLSLVQFLDFRLLLETEPNEEEILAAAARSRAEGALLLSLAAARAVVGGPFGRSLRVALEARVPQALVRRARELDAGDPLDLVAPSQPSLSRARLALAGGRRLELIARTVAPMSWPGQPRPGRVRGVLAGLERARRLLGREVERARGEGLVPAAREP